MHGLSRLHYPRARRAPLVVYSEDQEVGRFGSLRAAFEAAQAAGGEINDDERSWLERWLLGARGEACEPGPAWLEKSFRRVHVGQSHVLSETRH
jgi:hypothetical protein